MRLSARRSGARPAWWATCRGFLMFNVTQLHPESRFPTLRTAHDSELNTYWCRMHSDLGSRPGRACFKTALIGDILSYQQRLGEQIKRCADPGLNRDIAHVVLASDADVFNLGGDLELFCQAIRRGDRQTLLDYAHQCVRGVHAFHDGLGTNAHTIALVQGDALGGGFEAALSCHTIVAEEGALMGLPEVLFDLFPGMGAYSFLCKRIAPHQAEKLMLEGNLYKSEELHRMGLVDVLVPRGDGEQAVHELIRKHRKIPHARMAMHRVRAFSQPVTLAEMMAITEIWVETALELGEKALRTMERLVRAQYRRGSKQGTAMA